MLYRLLRRGEHIVNGLRAKNPNSWTSVFDHVTTGSKRGSVQSPYISTCGSLNSVLEFRRKSWTRDAQIVQISEDNLPVVKIDLRTASNRKNHFKLGSDSNASINDFNNFARVYEEVLLVGYVPETHVQLMNEFDFDREQLPV
jgi:mitochondrial fission protein ELM1